MPPGSRKTFPELGRAAAGQGGMRAVFLFCSLELFGATIMLLMVAWQQLELLLPAAGALRAWPGEGGRARQPSPVAPSCVPPLAAPGPAAWWLSNARGC